MVGCRVLDIQKVFNYEALLSLALHLEVYVVGRRWVHSFDNKSRGPWSCIAAVRRNVRWFLQELDELVGDSPRALHKAYTLGYPHQALKALEGGMVVRGGTLVRAVGWPGTWV